MSIVGSVVIVAVRRVVMQNNIDYPMFGDQYAQRKDYSADLIHQHALNWLKHQQKGKPFFGVFTYTLPHAELTQPNDSLVAFYKKKFLRISVGRARRLTL